MRRILSFLVIMLCLACIIGCSDAIESKPREKKEKVSSEQPVSVYDAIVECVKENGEQNDSSGDYYLVLPTDTGKVTACYRSEGYLSFYSSFYSGSIEDSDYVEQIRMDVYTIPDKYILSYTISKQDYTMSYIGKAEIYPSDVSKSYISFQILEDSVRPSSSGVLSSARELFKVRIEPFLDDTNTLLNKYTDYSVVDLGFTNWR